jgi:hypothetical protein
MCPDPQLAVCCFCGTTTTTTYSLKDGSWRAVVSTHRRAAAAVIQLRQQIMANARNDVQHGRAASGAVVQLHPLRQGPCRL